jgi:hypothetical protein
VERPAERMTLTPARTGVVSGCGGRGSTPSRSAGCGAVSRAALLRADGARQPSDVPLHEDHAIGVPVDGDDVDEPEGLLQRDRSGAAWEDTERECGAACVRSTADRVGEKCIHGGKRYTTGRVFARSREAGEAAACVGRERPGCTVDALILTARFRGSSLLALTDSIVVPTQHCEVQVAHIRRRFESEFVSEGCGSALPCLHSANDVAGKI